MSSIPGGSDPPEARPEPRVISLTACGAGTADVPYGARVASEVRSFCFGRRTPPRMATGASKTASRGRPSSPYSRRSHSSPPSLDSPLPLATAQGPQRQRPGEQGSSPLLTTDDRRVPPENGMPRKRTTTAALRAAPYEGARATTPTTGRAGKLAPPDDGRRTGPARKRDATQADYDRGASRRPLRGRRGHNANDRASREARPS